jgi:hypothetical protein
MKRLLLTGLLSTLLGIGTLFATRPVCADEAAWGTIKGQVVWGGQTVPEPKVVDLKDNKDREHCLSKGPIVSEELVVNPKNKGVRWAFVWLEPEPGDPPLKIHPKLAAIEKKQIEVDQPCCKFEPHALGLRQGQEIVAKNSAPVPHNINWTGGSKNPGNNVIIPAGGSYTIKDLQADKLSVKIVCNIHGWMGGWVRIFDHPYFAITDENGKFEIKHAPAGKFRLRGWHEATGWVPDKKGIEIVIKGNEVTDAGDIKMETK